MDRPGSESCLLRPQEPPSDPLESELNSQHCRDCWKVPAGTQHSQCLGRISSCLLEAGPSCAHSWAAPLPPLLAPQAVILWLPSGSPGAPWPPLLAHPPKASAGSQILAQPLGFSLTFLVKTGSLT